jgi:hypothetical protein
MSNKQIEHVRNVDLARRVKLAMGGVPTLRLVTADERPDPREARLAASRLELARIFGGGR